MTITREQAMQAVQDGSWFGMDASHPDVWDIMDFAMTDDSPVARMGMRDAIARRDADPECGIFWIHGGIFDTITGVPFPDRDR